MAERVLEGTWEEIAVHAGELTGRRLRLILLDDHNGEVEAEQDVLRQHLSELLEAADRLPRDPMDESNAAGCEISDMVAEKFRKQGFQL